MLDRLKREYYGYESISNFIVLLCCCVSVHLVLDLAEVLHVHDALLAAHMLNNQPQEPSSRDMVHEGGSPGGTMQ